MITTTGVNFEDVILPLSRIHPKARNSQKLCGDVYMIFRSWGSINLVLKRHVNFTGFIEVFVYSKSPKT